MLTPIERFVMFLQIHHPGITLQDIKLSHRPGHVEIVPNTKALISIQRVGYPLKDQEGKHNSINRLWNELHEYYNANVVIQKRKNNMPTVILWSGQRFTYDNQNNKKMKGGEF